MKQVMALFLVILSLNSFSQDTTNLDMVPVFSIRASAKIPATYKTIQGDELRKLYQGQEIPTLLNTTPSIVTSTDGYTNVRFPNDSQTYRLRISFGSSLTCTDEKGNVQFFEAID